MAKMFRVIAAVLLAAAFFAGCGSATTPPPPSATPNVQVVSETSAATPIPVLTSEPMPRYGEYNVSLDINPELRLVKGIEKVMFRNLTGLPMSTLSFHCYFNTFSESSTYKPYFEAFAPRIFPGGTKYGAMNIISVQTSNTDMPYLLKDAVLTVTFAEPLKADGEIEISIQFDAFIPEMNHRTGGNLEAMWFGNFIPLLVGFDKKWNPNEYYPAGNPFYSNIANFNVKIVTPADYVVAATGDAMVTETDGKKTSIFVAKRMRDFAFAIGKSYDVSSVKTDGGVLINLYTFSDGVDTQALMKAAADGIQYFSGILGSYPYSSFDIVETGLFMPCGMSYPMLMFIDSEALTDGVPYVLHEVGRQWFYNMLGNNQVEESWLSEGFVTYLQERVYKTQEQIALAMKNDYNYLRSKISALGNNANMSRPLSVYKSWNDYDMVQCTRAKLMVYSLNRLMGDEKFNEFLKAYFSQFIFRTASKKEFIQAAENVYGESLTEFFKGWLENNSLPQFQS